MFRLLVIVAAFAVSGCCPDQIPGGGRPPGGGPSTPPPPTGPTVAGYDLTAAIPLSGLLSGEMILGAALDEGSDRLYLVGSGAVVYTLDLAPPHRTLSVVRRGRAHKVSHPRRHVHDQRDHAGDPRLQLGTRPRSRASRASERRW